MTIQLIDIIKVNTDTSSQSDKEFYNISIKYRAYRNLSPFFGLYSNLGYGQTTLLWSN